MPWEGEKAFKAFLWGETKQCNIAIVPGMGSAKVFVLLASFANILESQLKEEEAESG